MEWNREPRNKPHYYINYFWTRVPRLLTLSIKGDGTTGYPDAKEMKLDLANTIYKIN